MKKYKEKIVPLKINPFKKEKVKEVDWKNVNFLNNFISDKGKIRSREITRVTKKQQRDVAKAIKLAREMALIPYISISKKYSPKER